MQLWTARPYPQKKLNKELTLPLSFPYPILAEHRIIPIWHWHILYHPGGKYIMNEWRLPVQLSITPIRISATIVYWPISICTVVRQRYLLSDCKRHTPVTSFFRLFSAKPCMIQPCRHEAKQEEQRWVANTNSVGKNKRNSWKLRYPRYSEIYPSPRE